MSCEDVSEQYVSKSISVRGAEEATQALQSLFHGQLVFATTVIGLAIMLAMSR